MPDADEPLASEVPGAPPFSTTLPRTVTPLTRGPVVLPLGATTMRAWRSAEPRVVVTVWKRKPYRLLLSACIIMAVSSALVASSGAPSLQRPTPGRRTRNDWECRYFPPGNTIHSPGFIASSAAWMAVVWSLVSLGA